MQTKRDDLQGWRALSILGVLLFHLWPTNFSNGYVGVDIFFVLSGYLMAMIFPIGKEIEAKDFVNFYFRRIKRIVPVYLVIILGTLFFLARSTLLREYNEIRKDSKWAIAFVSNLQDGFTELDYFDVESKYRFFRHCWSLAVEMQFYLIFPFIGFLRTKINKKAFQLFLLIIFLASITYQLTSDNPITKYESVISRIWQFAAGILAHSLSFKPIPKITYGLLVITIALIFMPYKISNSIISLLAVICASSTITLSSAEFHPFSKFIPNLNIYQNFIFLGDISYALYLIHWPIITYAFSISASGNIYLFDGTLIAVTCIALALLAHKIIEKPLINFCSDLKKLAVALGILYLAVIFLPLMFKKMAFNTSHQSQITLKYLHSAEKLTKPIWLPESWTSNNDIEAAEWMMKQKTGLGFFIPCNYKHSIHLPKMPKNLVYCEYNRNPEATLTAVIVGNSIALSLQYAIVTNPAFRKVIFIAALGCTFPYVKEEGKQNCKEPANAMKRLIGQIEPDIVYIIQAYLGYIARPLKTVDWKDDWRWKHWNETFQFIQKHSSAIIINEEHVRFPFQTGEEFSKRKFHGIDFSGRIRRPKANLPLYQKLSAIHCPKCFWFNYKSAFCGKHFCDSLDAENGLPLCHDHHHLSIFGLRKIKPTIDKVTKKALAQIKKDKLV